MRCRSSTGGVFDVNAFRSNLFRAWAVKVENLLMMRLVAAMIVCWVSAGCTYQNLGEVEKPDAKTACIKVSFIDGICGQVALKIEDSRYADLGETWNGHAQVFYTVLPCDAPGDFTQRSFFVQLLEEQDLGNCARCEALFVYTGTKRYHVRIVDQCG